MLRPQGNIMAKEKDVKALVEVTKTTQTLLTHFQSSLAPSSATTPPEHQTAASTELPSPLDVVKATTTLLKSHTTTLSLLLINPPLTPSALIAKIGDVSSGALSGMVAAASYVPPPGRRDDLGHLMRTELRAHVRRLLGTWGDVLALVLRMAEARQGAKGKERGPSGSEKQDVLSATGVLWEACDVLLKLCNDGVVGLVVKKAGELRATLLDAIEELKEWGEDVADDEDLAEGSDEEEEDDMFGASNKLGKDDKELKELLDASVKKLKMVGMLYQALIKRRLKTYPAATTSTTATTTNDSSDATSSPAKTLDNLMAQLKTIPDIVDELASAFYDLDADEATQTLNKACNEATNAAELVKQSWTGTDDEFTAWSAKWTTALQTA